MVGTNRSRSSSDDASAVIRAAIAADASLSFRYEKPDGTVTRHNAVYPKQLFDQGEHILVRAYCHFTRDSRIFRVDRIRAVRIRTRPQDYPLRYDIAGALISLALLAAVFLSLLLFSPKYRWRQLRHRLIGTASRAAAVQTNVVSSDSSGYAAEQPNKPLQRTSTLPRFARAGARR